MADSDFLSALEYQSRRHLAALADAKQRPITPTDVEVQRRERWWGKHNLDSMQGRHTHGFLNSLRQEWGYHGRAFSRKPLGQQFPEGVYRQNGVKGQWIDAEAFFREPIEAVLVGCQFLSSPRHYGSRL